MKTAKILGAIGALMVAALVGGALITSVAAESPSTTADPDVGQYCQSFRSHLADALNTDADGLTSAFRSAAETTIDEAVAAGDLTRERADEMKSRLADADLDGCFGLGRGLVGHPRGAALGVDLGAAAADALGMQPSALAGQLHAGKSLQDVAEAQHVDYATVKKAVLDAAKADLDKAVAAERLTADQEQRMLDRLSDALDSGDWPPARAGRGHGAGHGAGPWHGSPDASDNPDGGSDL